jgi:inner membrane protein
VDSVSQFVLGASVSAAAMGTRTAVWKAALWGGVAGTLPDLDVFIDHGDALSNMVRHRAETHSLFWLSLASPLLAAIPGWLHGRGAAFRRWWLAIWLALVTHPLLDAMTVYGTQLLLPFTDHPFGVGSIFIIDPLYTVPLLVGLVVAVLRTQARGLAWVHVGLWVSTAYLAWSVAAQWHVRSLVQAALPNAAPASVLVTPSPFNTLLWRIVVMEPDGRYREGFRSLLDGDRPIRFTQFEAQAVPDMVRALPAVQRLAAFSHGFTKVHTVAGQARVTDLRMGQEPNYSFSFEVAVQEGATWRPVPPRNQGSRGDVRAGLAWLWKRMWGEDVAPSVPAA